jgi:hypothetical protein
MTDVGTRSKVIMGNFFTRIRERSFALALTVAAVLTFGAVAAAPATAVEQDTNSETISVVETTSVVETQMPTISSTPFATATISGSVTGDRRTVDSSDDVAIAGAYVYAYSNSALPVKMALSDSDGNYSLQGLESGSYAVSFSHYDTASGFAYANQYWNDAPTVDGSTRIDLAADEDVTGIDATLHAMDPVIAGELTIVGSAVVGSTLVANPGVWGPGEVELYYAWLRDDVQIFDRNVDYVVTADDVGHTISLSVWGWKFGYAGTEARVSTEVVTVTAPTPTPSATPTPTATATPTPTTAPATEPAVTGGPTPASVVGAKSDRVTTPAATLVVGASIPITGEGFAPFEVVDIWLHSTPILLGTLTANAQGSISGSFAMPSGLPTGTHHVVLVDEAGVSYTSAELVVTTTAALASTGADISSGWLALALMVLGGLALTVTARRRTASALK